MDYFYKTNLLTEFGKIATVTLRRALHHRAIDHHARVSEPKNMSVFVIKRTKICVCIILTQIVSYMKLYDLKLKLVDSLREREVSPHILLIELVVTIFV